jgi:S-DNA-T family DNA segregation ATPase FtsK/SpoIIIE
MAFSLATLKGETPAPAPGWRTPFALFVTAVIWLLAVLALATHDPTDAAFSTSGDGGPVHNLVGTLGAWFSDVAYTAFGYSVWWAALVALRAWLGVLARSLRGAARDDLSPERPPWLFWLGVLVLLAASAALESTRLYRFEPGVAGGHAGGVAGYVLGAASQKLLGFTGSGVFWIAALVAGAGLALQFSWLRLAERIGAGLDRWRTRRSERLERAEDEKLGEIAQREREQVVEVEHALHEEALPIVIEPPVLEVPKSVRVAKERQQPLFR